MVKCSMCNNIIGERELHIRESDDLDMWFGVKVVVCSP